jgi:bacterioferritin-associated ferredoxin
MHRGRPIRPHARVLQLTIIRICILLVVRAGFARFDRSEMYVCICNSVTESDIREAVREGVRDQRELAFKTGCSTECGCCADFARDVLNQALREQGRFLQVVRSS